MTRRGLNADNLADVFKDRELQERIDAEIMQWQKLGISSVPTLIFNNILTVNGSQSVEGYRQILTDALG